MKALALPKNSKEGGPMFNWLKKMKGGGAATPSPLPKLTTTVILPRNQEHIVLDTLRSGPDGHDGKFPFWRTSTVRDFLEGV